MACPTCTATQVTSWLSYNPYLPVMTLFGLPSAAGLGGLAGNSGVWIAIGTVVPLAAAFWIARPHRGCATCRRDALLATAVAVASPVVGLNLAVITTDPPVLAFILLALALAARPRSPLACGNLAGRRGGRLGRRPGRRLRPEVHRLARRPGPGRDVRRPRRRAGRGALCRGVGRHRRAPRRRPRAGRADLAAGRGCPGAEQRAVPARPHPVQDPGREPAARAPAHRDGRGRARRSRSACCSRPGWASRSRW